MNYNIGKIDALIRQIIGTGILLTGIFMHSFVGLLGLVFTISAVTRKSLLYFLVGITTASNSEEE